MIVKEKNGIKYEIDKKNNFARVIDCSYDVKDVFIPHFISYDSHKYPIKIISKEAFSKTKPFISINFPEDSELQTIECLAFSNGVTQNIYLPPSIIELEDGWCQSSGKSLDVSVSPKNKRFSNFNEDIIIGKSDLQMNGFDTLYFASRLIKYVDIPPSIKKINSFAFSECDSLLYVKIPENSQLETIGRNAFELTIIAKIFIPKHVKTIGEAAFARCTNLTKVDFDPNSELHTIEKDAFLGTSIEYFYIPSNLKNFKGGWCRKMKYLRNATISPNNKYFVVFEEKMIIGKTNIEDEIYDTLYFVPYNVNNFDMPSFIRKINDRALDNCQFLSTVSFTDDSKLEIIGKYAFPSSITDIRIPKSVTTIDDFAFKACHNLEKVEFAEDSKLMIIGKKAFRKSSLKSICIPKLVKKIDDEAFKECRWLKEVYFMQDSELEIIGESSFESTEIEKIVIPKNVEIIEKNAFSECTKLKEISFEKGSKLKIIKESAFKRTEINELLLPGSIETLETGCFQNMNELNKVDFDPPNDHFKILDNKIILGQSQSKYNDEYDVLYFAPRNITEVKIPSHVKEISSYAFSGCSKLKQLHFECDSKLNKICYESFSYSSLTEICFPKHVKIIDDFSFLNCINLRKITFSDDSELQVIGEKAFYETAIKSVKVPSSVIEIKDNAFLMCSSLESFEFLDIQNSQIQCINKGMLSGSSIRSIAIPNSVKRIEEAAFYNCRKLERFDISDDSQLTKMDYIAFSECPIKKFHIPPLVRKFKESTLSTETTEISVSPKNKYLSVIDSTMIVGKSDMNNDKFDTILYALRNIEKAIIPSYIKKIDNKAFRYCKKLEKIEFAPNSKLEIIGKYAFESSGLTNISIPDHVKIIDDNAFCCCYLLKNCEYTNNIELEVIGESAFVNCQIEKFVIPKSVKIIKNAFSFSNNETIEFSYGSMLKCIDEWAFAFCGNKSFVIPRNVTEIKQNAFRNTYQLEKIVFPEDSELQIIQNNAFENTKLNSINFPSQLKELGKYWAYGIFELVNISISPKNQYFKYLDEKIIVRKSDLNNNQYDTIVFALRDIEHAFIPSYIKKINPYAFQFCKNLKSIEFSDNSQLEIIDDYAFNNTSITTLVVPKCVKIIGEECFSYSSLQSIIFQDNSELNFIGDSAFSSTDIKKIVIPNRDIKIQLGVFGSCKNLEELVISDSIDSIYPIASYLGIKKIYVPPRAYDLNVICYDYLKEIHISPENKYFADVEGQMIIKKSNPNSDVYDILYKSIKSIEYVTIPSYIRIIGSRAFNSRNCIKSFKFIENSQLEKIENNAFEYSSISTIYIPDSVKEIERSAFAYCYNLQTVEISNNITFFGNNVFTGCNCLQNVIFKENSKQKVIGKYTFNYSSITSIYIVKSIKRIDFCAFNNCKQLREVNFAQDSELEIIGENSFESTGIEKIVIPRNVEIIEENAFSNCTELKVISFEKGSKLRIIKKSAFEGTEINELLLPGSIETLETGCFQNMNKLNKVDFDPPNDHFKILDNKIILVQSKNQFKSDFEKDKITTKYQDETFDVLILAMSDVKKIRIPSYIRVIESFAFSNCLKLYQVIIDKDSKLEKICSKSFCNSSIKNIFIPKNVKLIDESCFNYCKNLTHVDFDPKMNALIKIKENAFNNTPLKGVIIPKSINEITLTIFGYNLNSIEFLSDTYINVMFQYNSIEISIMSFPNANYISISNPNYYDQKEIRIYVLPLTKIEYISNNYYSDSNHDYDYDYDI